MIRRFNYTDRRKLLRENFRFWWLDDGGGTLRFGTELKLDLEQPLDPAAGVFIEAYSGPVVMRFPFGTVARIEAPEDTLLTAFPPGQKPLFRVKVVDMADTRKRLLAWADSISPLTDEERQGGRRSILPVETVDLGHQVWHLKLEGTQPILQLNSQIREPRHITTLAREADFIALVYPALIRQVLETLLFGEEADSVGPDHDWMIFGKVLAQREPPDSDSFGDDQESWRSVAVEWIEEAVIGFCAQNQTKDLFIQHRKEAEERTHA